ncbi:MAG: two component transcriptional regulator, winged helix family [Ilumatobacteraceae bacterium]|nr:two component transcriptional regulator, winged helix family [Ilumatobacteraceae bacterium]
MIEDQHAQHLGLRRALEERGHQVELASNGKDALQLVRVVDADLVVLDLDLTDMDGLDLCRHLRALVRCPIVAVSSDAREAHIVTALDIGADDYVLKPFSTMVLLARIRVALRHHAAIAAVVDDQVLEAGDLRVDIGAHQVMIDGTLVDMPPRQFMLLVLLMRYPGKVLTYTAMGQGLGNFEPDPMNRNSWHILVSKIRKQLGTGPHRPVIESELNVGYRLRLPIALP